MANASDGCEYVPGHDSQVIHSPSTPLPASGALVLGLVNFLCNPGTLD